MVTSMLPNAVLKPNFPDVLALRPILHQLTFLSVCHNYNGKLPYLLREVLPNGLPDLKSLHTRAVSITGNRPDIIPEGGRWFECLHGHVHERWILRDMFSSITGNYLESIAVGIPNFVELALETCGLPTNTSLSNLLVWLFLTLS